MVVILVPVSAVTVHIRLQSVMSRLSASVVNAM